MDVAEIGFEGIAGTATAGIPHATTLADRLKKPLIYVRAVAKTHGMGNQIEGQLTEGQNVLLIEDLIYEQEVRIHTMFHSLFSLVSSLCDTQLFQCFLV